MADMLRHTKVNRARWRSCRERPELLATDAVDFLVRRRPVGSESQSRCARCGIGEPRYAIAKLAAKVRPGSRACVDVRQPSPRTATGRASPKTSAPRIKREELLAS